MPSEDEKEVFGFDRFSRICVTLVDGESIYMNKILWDLCDWGVLYGDNRQTTLYPWHRISEICQVHD